MTGPGRKFDIGKLRYDLILPEFEEGLAAIITMGAEKCEPNNWQKIDNAEDRYYAALRRHISSYRKGELVDEESGKSHLYHAACCLMFLDYFARNKKSQPAQG